MKEKSREYLKYLILPLFQPLVYTIISIISWIYLISVKNVNHENTLLAFHNLQGEFFLPTVVVMIIFWIILISYVILVLLDYDYAYFRHIYFTSSIFIGWCSITILFSIIQYYNIFPIEDLLKIALFIYFMIFASNFLGFLLQDIDNENEVYHAQIEVNSKFHPSIIQTSCLNNEQIITSDFFNNSLINKNVMQDENYLNVENARVRILDQSEEFKFFKKVYDDYIESDRTKLPRGQGDLLKDPSFFFKDSKTFKKYALESFKKITGDSQSAENIYRRLFGKLRPQISIEINQKFLSWVRDESYKYLKNSSYTSESLNKKSLKYGISPGTAQKYAKRYLIELYNKSKGKKIYEALWPPSKLSSSLSRKLNLKLMAEISNYLVNNDYNVISLNQISKDFNIALSTVVYFAQNLLGKMEKEGKLAGGSSEEIYNQMWPSSEHLNEEQVDELKKIIENEVNNYLDMQDYLPKSLNQLAKEMGVHRITITKRAKEILNEMFSGDSEDIFSQLWPQNKLSEMIIFKIENVIESEMHKYLNMEDYEPKSLNSIADDLKINVTSLQRYAKAWAIEKENEDLYTEIWPSKQLTEDREKGINEIILKEINKWEQNKNYIPISIHKISIKENAHFNTISALILRQLRNTYGKTRGIKIYRKLWPYEKIDEKIIDNIKKIAKEEVQKINQGKIKHGLPIHKIAQKVSVSSDSVKKYIIEYLTDIYGKSKGIELYTEIWLDNEFIWRYIGIRIHVLLNSFQTKYFNQKDVIYFGEPQIAPSIRPDGLILNDNHFPKTYRNHKLLDILKSSTSWDLLNLDELDFNKIKGMILDYTFDPTEANLLDKIKKYQNKDLFLLLILLNKSGRDSIIEIKTFEEMAKESNVRIIGINKYMDLIGLTAQEKSNISEILALAYKGDLKALNQKSTLKRKDRYGLPELRRELKNIGLVKNKIAEYFDYPE